MQYSKGNDRQIQLAITAQKSVSLQFEAAGRDAQTYSKELYLWGQEQTDDIKDVTDRAAYLNFVHGQLNTDLANKLDTARGPWKTARATESTSGTLETSGHGSPAVANEAVVEQRNALKLGEAARWKAIREYAEKLILLSQAAEVIIDECLPATAGQPYTGKQRTADVRSTLQKSLDNWHLNPAISATSPFAQSHPSSGSFEERSFGETHRQELDRTPSVLDRQKADQEALEAHAHGSGVSTRPGPAPATSSTGVNPSQLNNAPAPVPIPAASSQSQQHSPPTAGSPTIPPTAPLNLKGHSSSGSGSGVALGAAAGLGAAGLASALSGSGSPQGGVVAVTDAPPSALSNNGEGGVSTSSHPTVAETGVPILAAGGPGPSSGTLKPSSPVAAAAASSPTWSGPAVGGVGGFNDPRSGAGAGAGAKYETAEEEKRRLEREDRERLLRFGSGSGASAGSARPNTNPPHPTAGPGPQGAAAAAAAAAQAASGSAPTPSASGPAVPPKNETAEEEKKRLEREERERLLRFGSGGGAGGSGAGGQQGPPPRDGDDGSQLPAYKPY